ncbi:hypothetical protein IPC1031_08690 [Pseudomonas aeruginosa]|uniref:hypothetical protein n=1 Tax=Pseudomonas aeruginosa TaxID=287 RepID=UPI000FF39FEC|nr:hypothetical protein [Pseudomonas aeruginosa]MBA5617475.1 hypothetical protein [Pseudomonas aeruginosa]MDH7951296.1 hypothetical protein [Pseudomonas aeruginosa]RPS12549.1 hypothetical protein IPC1031_08690 [Pseudomonas aeruginosa]HBP5667130.1 hypothetical protein [Pseudomonas aeruginosa]HEJ5865048.1 hypothetical protein [Pseudomonas aeruginosa]
MPANCCAHKERPILFSGPMVRVILEGRKTVTRRVMKPQPDFLGPMVDPNTPFKTLDAGLHARITCPYGEPGDRLWVRETWTDVNMCGAPALAYRADEDMRDLMEEPGFLDDRGAFNYDDPRVKPYPFACWYAELDQARWRPSIHMPRWASRILLEITAVRVERLQDISEEQALAEGVRGEPCDHARQACADIGCWGDTAKGAFGFLWESLNGEGSWAANPWVWVVEFKRVTP